MKKQTQAIHPASTIFCPFTGEQRREMDVKDGEMFGPGGEGYMRINVATPRSVLLEALERLHAAVEKITNQG